MRSLYDPKAWHKPHQPMLDVYLRTGSLPREAQDALISQAGHAACSIAANIADGCARSSQPDCVRYWHIAAGSASELDYELLLTRGVKVLDQDSCVSLAQQVTEVQRMSRFFSEKLRADG